jgi:hypothetical protein
VNEFVFAVNVMLSKIVEDPDRWPSFADVRRCVLKRFPYNVLFRFNDEQIEIVAIAHHKRRPGYWSRRR